MIPDLLPDETPLRWLSRHFQDFAANHTKGSSPLYTTLTYAVAQDETLLELASHAPREPIPNILLGAVHYLLLKGVAHPLATYYPSVTENVDVHGDPVPTFRNFCNQYRSEIIHLMQTRLVQTSEVNRCALLLPAFGMVAQTGVPLALVEMGASAGLNLLWDYYDYDYGNNRRLGNSDASLSLSTELRGTKTPPIPDSMPIVDYRIGMDLNPIDVQDEDAVLWLRALIWPEQAERTERFAQAIQIARAHQPQIIAGDALETLPNVLHQVPDDLTLCFYHTFVINQFSPEERDQLTALLLQYSKTRPIHRISIEWLKTEHPQLELRRYQHGEEIDHHVLAYGDAHGRWLEWH